MVPFVKNAFTRPIRWTEFVNHNSEGATERGKTDDRRRRFKKNKGDMSVDLARQGNITNYKMTVSSDGSSATLEINNMQLSYFISNTMRWLKLVKHYQGQTTSEPYKQKVYFKLAFNMVGQASDTFFYVKSFEYQGQDLLIDFEL